MCSRSDEAAEALFAPKRPAAEPPVKPTVPEPAAPPANEATRKPRVLRALPRAPAREEPVNVPTPAALPAVPEPLPQPAVPASHRSRIRTWLRYGMTVSQVAVVYGVAAGDIERLLQGA